VPFAEIRSSGALPRLDHPDQQQFAALSRVRRAVAAAATAEKQLELQLGQIAEQQAGDHSDMPRPEGDPQLETLRHRRAAAKEKTKRLFAISQRLQVKIEAFRLAKEAAEAAYIAAEQALHASEVVIRGDDV